MGSIEKKLIEKIESLKNIYSDSDKVKEYQKSIDQFEELIKKGITQKRGYNLLSLSDAPIKSQVWFNAK